eukprot:4468557-Amphidinium_carterae.1
MACSAGSSFTARHGMHSVSAGTPGSSVAGVVPMVSCVSSSSASLVLSASESLRSSLLSARCCCGTMS